MVAGQVGRCRKGEEVKLEASMIPNRHVYLRSIYPSTKGENLVTFVDLHDGLLFLGYRLQHCLCRY